MTTGEDELQFDAAPWAAAGAQNEPVPPITPAEIATPGSAIDQLLAALGIASNTGIPDDNTDTATGQAEREAGVTAAQTNFPANDQQSAQMLQALPQLLTGVAGAFGGALGGALQPFSQLAQQGAQAAQQGLQAGLGATQQAEDPFAELDDDAFDEAPEDLGDIPGGWDDGAGGSEGAGGTGGGGGFGDTAPASPLGPPPTPSPATYPASAPSTPASPAAPPTSSAAPRGPMGAVPFMPPGNLQGGATGDEPKADTKRVMAPSIKNGAPVQGRISAPPAPPVTKHVKGKPVATRRILAPEQNDDDQSGTER
jgi:hypothetical protein